MCVPLYAIRSVMLRTEVGKIIVLESEKRELCAKLRNQAHRSDANENYVASRKKSNKKTINLGNVANLGSQYGIQILRDNPVEFNHNLDPDMIELFMAFDKPCFAIARMPTAAIAELDTLDLKFWVTEKEISQYPKRIRIFCRTIWDYTQKEPIPKIIQVIGWLRNEIAGKIGKFISKDKNEKGYKGAGRVDRRELTVDQLHPISPQGELLKEGKYEEQYEENDKIHWKNQPKIVKEITTNPAVYFKKSRAERAIFRNAFKPTAPKNFLKNKRNS